MLGLALILFDVFFIADQLNSKDMSNDYFIVYSFLFNYDVATINYNNETNDNTHTCTPHIQTKTKQTKQNTFRTIWIIAI